MEEPLRMRCNIRMVGRTIHHIIERNLDFQLTAGGDKLVPVVPGTELRLQRHVAAVFVTDRPGTADVAWYGNQAVVLALAKTVTDGVDRRQIDDVETHRLDVVQATDAVLQGAMPVRHVALRTREELIPGGKTGDWPIDHDRQRWRQLMAFAAIGVAGHHAAHDLADAQINGTALLAGSQRSFDGRDDAQHAAEILALRHGGRLLEDHQTLEQFAPEVCTRYALLADFVHPRQISFGIRLDRVLPATDRGDRKLTEPAVVVALRHRAFLPFLVTDLARLEHGRQFVMAFLVDVGADGNLLADDALDGETATDHLRLDRFDDHTRVFFGNHHHSAPKS
ncbi:MAG: hypothetical protein AW09_000466 [Candidatus Accumulibacter phosphatis]|uniref:Uncharacterized protein n=1 Tax=Candidatus Accumulibacter phosphatis TaxID=327160 RepID=A0A080MAU0_9PROT|nr:MAG: hypothetical protein AW09_000466 [Candidatus Accumulibacter phosphatis]